MHSLVPAPGRAHAHADAHASPSLTTHPLTSPGDGAPVDPRAASPAQATFADLGLTDPVLSAVSAEGYIHPTPIQARAIPYALEGRDILGCAQTGTGKTAAFSLPILQRLAQSRIKHPNQHQHRHLRALILSPTRELAVQIDESLRTYGRGTHLRSVCIFGGVTQNPQVRALRQGVDIAVATPGRLEDLMRQGHVNLAHVEVFVLDEADRMLDMGFIEPIRRVAGMLPAARQTLLFSATMPKPIRHLADALLKDPVSVQVAAVSSTPDRVQQALVLVAKRDKPALLVDLLTSTYVERAIVFSRTKHGADRITKHLNQNDIPAEAIHGDKRQNVRQRALAGFRDGRVQVLVATDIAARGIDVDDVSHVVNFDIPHEPETYVHRIGRTARAGAAGKAISFCDPDSDERDFMRGIERLLKRRIDVIQPHIQTGGPRPGTPNTRDADEPAAVEVDTDAAPTRSEPAHRSPSAPPPHTRRAGPRDTHRDGPRNTHRGDRPHAHRGHAPRPHAHADQTEGPSDDGTDAPALHAPGHKKPGGFKSPGGKFAGTKFTGHKFEGHRFSGNAAFNGTKFTGSKFRGEPTDGPVVGPAADHPRGPKPGPKQGPKPSGKTGYPKSGPRPGKPANGKPAHGKPAHGKPGFAKASHAKPGQGQPGQGQPGHGQSGHGPARASGPGGGHGGRGGHGGPQRGQFNAGPRGPKGGRAGKGPRRGSQGGR